MAGLDVDEQLRVLRAGTVDCITDDELRDKLAAGRPLRVKLGLDPTASDIHLGSAVVLRKLRAFQDLGHVAVLIIGDFTARVGDPSGRSTTRPALSADEIDAHATTYVDQARRILLAEDRLEVRYNSEWLGGLDMADVLRLTSRVTVARLLERNDFSTRYDAGEPISLMELLYPLLQGWDSVVIDADVELGGTDQLFNILMGRHLQEQVGRPPQVVLTNPLLVGIGGGEKMSKSVGNHVGITEPPGEQFGKLMRIPDELMPDYFQLTTGWGPDRVNHTLAELGRASPADRARLKRLLARSVVDLYHGDGAGGAAETEFGRVFKEHATPTEVEEFVLPPEVLRDGKIEVARLLALAGLVRSNREGRRKIGEGGVHLGDDLVTDPELEVGPAEVDGRTLRLGRRRWRRIRAG